MPANAVLVNFSGGETSPRSRGRFDAPWYQTSCRKLLNFIAELTGSARFRSGFQYCRQTRGGAVPRLLGFQVNDNLAYMLEFTPGFMRVYLQSTKDLLTSTVATITGVTQAAQGVVTVSSATGLSNGKELILSGILGMAELNNRQVIISNLSGTSFKMKDPVTSAYVSTEALTAYISGGRAAVVYELATPYGANDLPDLQIAGSRTLAYITCPGQSPQKLTVDSSNNFTIGSYTRTADPFTGQTVDIGSPYDTFQSGGLAAWTATGTTAVLNAYWNGNTSVASSGIPGGYAYASSPNSVIGAFIGSIQAPQTVAYGTWQIDVGSACGSNFNGGNIDTNYMEWRFSMVDANNYYYMFISGPSGTVLTLGVSVAGVRSILKQATITGIFAQPSGRTFRITRSSSGVFTMRDSNVTVLQHTDNTHTTSTIMQIRVGTSGNAVETGATSTSICTYNIGGAEPHAILCWVRNVYASSVSSDENPIGVAFYEGRLVFAGTNQRPDCIFLSRSPDSNGNSRYDDFTGGSNADFACFFQLAPTGGSTDFISWARGGPDYLFVGTFGGPYRISGSGLDIPITPSSINVRQFDDAGCAATMAAGLAQMFFVQRSGVSMRSIKVINPYLATFESADLCQNAEHIGYSALQRVILQRGRPDSLWSYREDGILCNMSVHITTAQTETLTGWARHKLGGTGAKVLDVGITQRATGLDQLWIASQRTVNGVLRGFVEIMADDVYFPDIEDYFSGLANRALDLAQFENILYRLSEQYVHVDAASTYDGSARGLTASATLTPSAGYDIANATGVVFTASQNVFTAQDVGSEIWKKPDAITGVGAGRAVITGYTSPTQVTATILAVFDSATAVVAGDWYIAVSRINGLYYLEGQNVAVVVDGSVYADGGQTADSSYQTVTVLNGTIILLNPAAVVHVGLPYVGLLESHNLEMGGRSGPAQSKARVISELYIRFMNSLGCEYGTDIYKMTPVEDRLSDATFDRVAPVFSGVKRCPYEDTSSAADDNDQQKTVVVMQRKPLPAVVEFIDIHYDTTDES